MIQFAYPSYFEIIDYNLPFAENPDRTIIAPVLSEFVFTKDTKNYTEVKLEFTVLIDLNLVPAECNFFEYTFDSFSEWFDIVDSNIIFDSDNEFDEEKGYYDVTLFASLLYFPDVESSSSTFTFVVQNSCTDS